MIIKRPVEWKPVSFVRGKCPFCKGGRVSFTRQSKPLSSPVYLAIGECDVLPWDSWCPEPVVATADQIGVTFNLTRETDHFLVRVLCSSPPSVSPFSGTTLMIYMRCHCTVLSPLHSTLPTTEMFGFVLFGRTGDSDGWWDCVWPAHLHILTKLVWPVLVYNGSGRQGGPL